MQKGTRYSNKVEVKGQQLRIRVTKPIKGAKFRTVDPGKRGRTQIVVQKPRGKKTTQTQSVRFNMRDFESKAQLKGRIDQLRVPAKTKVRAKKLVDTHFSQL